MIYFFVCLCFVEFHLSSHLSHSFIFFCIFFFVLFLPRSFLCRLLVWPINFLLFPFPFHLLLDFFSAPLLFHKPVTPTFPCCWTYSPQLRRHRTVPHFGGFRQLHSFFGVGVPHFGGIGQSHISGRSVQTVPHFFGVGQSHISLA